MENLGLVGFTGAGANRLFSALTGLPVPSEYEAAVGVASLPDVRLARLTEMSKSKKTVAAGFELVHLALPPGSKPGEGLGAKFLGTLRNCDATKASRGACDPSSASEPAVVFMRSPVSMLSLIRSGMPCSGPRAPFAWRS